MEALGFHWPSLVVYGVNFAILLGILYVVGYKPIFRLLDERSRRIREGLEQAERLQREAAERQAEMQRQLDEARKEGQALIGQARELAERFREEERQRARQEAEAFLQRARADIERERQNAVEEVRRQFAELAIVAAERVIQRSLDRAAHQEVIEKVLKETTDFGARGP